MDYIIARFYKQKSIQNYTINYNNIFLVTIYYNLNLRGFFSFEFKSYKIF